MIDRETVEKVARLARLELAPDEVERLVKELGSILDHVARLSELDLHDVPTLAHAPGAANVYREDTPGPVLSAEEALANAPESDGRFFRVPPVIDGA